MHPVPRGWACRPWLRPPVRQGMSHAGDGAGIALLANLVVQVPRVVTARFPALAQIGLERADHGVPSRARCLFWEAVRAQEATHRGAPHAQAARDLALCDALLVESADLLVARVPPGAPCLLVLGRTGCRPSLRRCGQQRWQRRGRRPQVLRRGTQRRVHGPGADQPAGARPRSVCAAPWERRACYAGDPPYPESATTLAYRAAPRTVPLPQRPCWHPTCHQRECP